MGAQQLAEYTGVLGPNLLRAWTLSVVWPKQPIITTKETGTGAPNKAAQQQERDVSHDI